MYSQDDLPKTVSRTLYQGSIIISMDFHPQQPSFLLVGTSDGKIAIWEVASMRMLAQMPFRVWDSLACSRETQEALAENSVVSVKRCIWSPDGQFLGVAFSLHIVHIYELFTNNFHSYRRHVEIDAHVGGVNDIAFSHPIKQWCIITCGDDKTIKLWDAVSGHKLYTFEGHEAPVYSVCPHHKKHLQFFFSSAIDGKIKAWLYDNMGPRVDYDAPEWTTMAYSADGIRLFSCGTSRKGESLFVEWNDSEGAIKRTFSGLSEHSSGVVQFDTTNNRFLAAGDESLIKFWDMDDKIMLTTTDADGGLQATPRLCFNKDGNLLAVTTSDNRIKILANADGRYMLETNYRRWTSCIIMLAKRFIDR